MRLGSGSSWDKARGNPWDAEAQYGPAGYPPSITGTLLPSQNTQQPATGNPDPASYTLQRSEQIGAFLILKINYPDCANYEGDKILVFKDVTWKQLAEQKLIDPHFSNNKEKISPIARFEPTEQGWEWARWFAASQI